MKEVLKYCVVPVEATGFAAHRLVIGGHRQMTWAVVLDGEYAGNIQRKDSKWVHDNWVFTFADHSPMLKDRKTWEARMKEARFIVWRAYKARTADMIDLSSTLILT